MDPTDKRIQVNRFSPLDSDLGSQNTAQGMTQDVYVLENKPQSSAMNSLALSNEHSRVKYSLHFLLQIRASSRQQDIHAMPIGDTQNNAGGSLGIPEELVRKRTFPYTSLPAELRQMILRELVPSKSIWNGTSFPKSCPQKYQRDYFEKTKYLQNRALAHWNMTAPPEDSANDWHQLLAQDAWGRNEPAVASILNARLVNRMFYHDIDAFFSHECTYWLMMGATEFFLFKCLALGPRYHHLLPRQANSLPTCQGDQLSWEGKDAHKGPLRHHNTLRKNRMLWEEMVESRWDRGRRRPGYLKFIGRFRNIQIVCFMGHIPDAEEALITILDGISTKPSWRN